MDDIFKEFVKTTDPSFYQKIKSWHITYDNREPKFGIIYYVGGQTTLLPDVVKLQEVWVSYLVSLPQKYQALPLLIKGTKKSTGLITDVHFGPVSE